MKRDVHVLAAILFGLVWCIGTTQSANAGLWWTTYPTWEYIGDNTDFLTPLLGSPAQQASVTPGPGWPVTVESTLVGVHDLILDEYFINDGTISVRADARRVGPVFGGSIGLAGGLTVWDLRHATRYYHHTHNELVLCTADTAFVPFIALPARFSMRLGPVAFGLGIEPLLGVQLIDDGRVEWGFGLCPLMAKVGFGDPEFITVGVTGSVFGRVAGPAFSLGVHVGQFHAGVSLIPSRNGHADWEDVGLQIAYGPY